MAKQKDGRYRAKVTVGRTADGKPVVKYASGKTKKELAEAVAQIKRIYVNGAAVERRDVLFGEFALNWFEAFKRKDLEPASVSMYKNILNNHLLPAFGDRQLRAISAEALQLFLNQSASSKSMVDQLYMTLRQLFTTALAKGCIDRDPCILLKKPKAPAGTKRELTPDETKAVQKVMQTHPHRLLLALLYHTGMRIGEVLGLQWRDVDLKNGWISVERDVDFKDGGKLGRIKTAAGKRKVPIPSELAFYLQQMPGVGETPVIQSESGKHLSFSTYRRWYESLMIALWREDPTIEARPTLFAARVEQNRQKRVLARNEVYEMKTDLPLMSILTPHYFRHNYASILYDAEIDVLAAARWLGHSDPATTLRIYTHLSQQRETANSRKVEAAFAK